MIIYPTFQEVQNAYSRMKYKFYVSKTYNLNIGSIRKVNSKSNKFDDITFVSYFTAFNEPIIHCFPSTTDPGRYWLMNPLNKKGTAILVPGQYPDSHMLGLHGRTGLNPYAALEQKSPMLYVRDNNKDDLLNFELYRDSKLLAIYGFWDNIKSNIHRASSWKIVQLIEQYSAGCQVLQNPKDFSMLIELVRIYLLKGFPNSLTYTLFEESQVWK